jgi:hypothetical protein
MSIFPAARMIDIISASFMEALKVALFVLVMMAAVDLLNIWTQGKLSTILGTGGKWKQYVIAALLGVMPGCLGSFAGVSLYMHGMISFGALTGLMLATAGDEQFVMLAMIPETALYLFLILFILGIAAGYITDFVIKKYNIKIGEHCCEQKYNPELAGAAHFFKEHLWKHIIKKHLLSIFLWTFGALLLISISLEYLDLGKITSEYSFALLLLGGAVGLIPESGPHLVFVTLFAKGYIPFSVLLTSSIVQDGHGMLPMLSYSFRDFLLIKGMNLLFGLGIGIIIYLIGF